MKPAAPPESPSDPLPEHEGDSDEASYSIRVAARITGVAPERIRAWEARYGAIRPARSSGGTRRYSVADLDRLQLLRQVVEAGHRIGSVARLDLSQLRACLPVSGASEDESLEEALSAVAAMEGRALRRVLLDRLRVLGPVEFARGFALTLAAEIGRRWEAGELPISAEHLASTILRSVLSGTLDSEAASGLGPSIAFATLSGERHDLGLLVAALVARGAGATAIFLGADIPEADLLRSLRVTRAEVIALGFVTMPPSEVGSRLGDLRRQLPEKTRLWIGGSGIEGCPPIRGVERFANLAQLEAAVLEQTASLEAARIVGPRVAYGTGGSEHEA